MKESRVFAVLAAVLLTGCGDDEEQYARNVKGNLVRPQDAGPEAAGLNDEAEADPRPARAYRAD